jgi:cysteinyl-tRNA synthetase
MVLKIYNTLSRKKENFKPLHKDFVGIYSCGPTVYWYQHIGNLRTYIFSDILKRVLKYKGFKVNHVINITDVGHLTSDADSGEDKIEKAAQKEHKSAQEIAEHYFSVFDKDLQKLNIIQPDIWCKATEHIKEQIELIKILEKKGYTYKTSDGIYFDTSKFKDYGKFAKLDIKGLQAGKRVGLGEKINKTDFALWKFSEEPGKRMQEWNSPWGVGFPGWHIECSAMSSKYLGEQFDIHTGGIDHIPIHHTNEIAQSECAFEKKPWVKFWMHGEFLTFKDGKMSKSSGKILTISDLEEKGFKPLVYRYFCLTTHYRKQLIFSMENLESAKNSYERLKNIISEIENDKKLNEKYLEEFENAINDDLDMPNALQVLWKLIRDEEAEGKFETIKKMDEVFGLKLLEKEKIKIPAEIKKLADERENARKNKDWKKADELRDKILKKGYQILDGKEGWEVKKI